MRRKLLKGFALTVLMLSLSFARDHSAHAQIDETPYSTPTPAPVSMVLPVVAEPEGLTNVALTEGVVVTASGRNGPGTGPWCVKDDSFLTSWKCTPGHEAWLEIDLKRLCRISQMIIVHPSILSASTGADLGAFNLHVSLRTTEGDTWGPAFPVQNTGNAPYLTLEFDPPTECRYARMTITTPALDGGPTARVVEWQVWGESLETYPPPWTAIDAGFESMIRTRLEGLQSWPFEEGYVQLISDLNNSGSVGLNPPTYADFVKAKAYLDLGFVLEEKGEIDGAYAAWENAKASSILYIAAQGAARSGHLLIVQARVEEALEELTWAIGVYPADSWARIELIDCYRFTGDVQRSRLMASEVLDRYPDHSTLGQAAWAVYKIAQMDGIDAEGSPAPRQTLYEGIWNAYRDADGHLPDVGDPIAKEVAFRCKWHIMRNLIEDGKLVEAIPHGEELLEQFPNRPGGWNACARAAMTRAYIRNKQFDKAWEQYNAMVNDYPDCEQAVELPALRKDIESREQYYKRLTER